MLELLLVMVIVAMTIGLVSFNIMQNHSQMLRKEAQRIALLLQLSKEEAVLCNCLVAFEGDAERYRFLVRANSGWQVLTDEIFRARTFEIIPVQLSIVPIESNGSADPSTLRIVFGREPVDKPFLMTLAVGTERAAIYADGIGHFSLQSK